MLSPTYRERRAQLTTYFDQTAAEAWKRLTSTQSVGRIRATVRAGRDTMRTTLLDWLPADLSGYRVLDAGCGTGALACEAARRGADVIAVDVAASLVEIARERAPRDALAGSLRFEVGDMLDHEPGAFDYVVAMDSLIHYRRQDIVSAVHSFSSIARRGVLFTYAPRTPALSIMHAVGRLIPHREHRAPAIAPVTESRLVRNLSDALRADRWRTARTRRVASGFYTSQALEIVKRA